MTNKHANKYEKLVVHCKSKEEWDCNIPMKGTFGYKVSFKRAGEIAVLAASRRVWCKVETPRAT